METPHSVQGMAPTECRVTGLDGDIVVHRDRWGIPHARAETAHDAGTGHVIYEDSTHLHGPLAMATAPNGDLLIANSDVINSDPNQPSEIVEFTIDGHFVKQLSVDPAQGGSFGIAVAAGPGGARLAYVDDNASTLTIWTLP